MGGDGFEALKPRGHEIQLSSSRLQGHGQLSQILSGESALDAQCGREQGTEEEPARSGPGVPAQVTIEQKDSRQGQHRLQAAQGGSSQPHERASQNILSRGPSPWPLL